jgi:hypothetical protein
MITLINSAFRLLIESGLVRTAAVFSRQWLGQSNGYYAYLRSSGCEPSIGSLAYLGEKLTDTSSLLLRFRPLTAVQARYRKDVFDLGMKLKLAVVKEALARQSARAARRAETLPGS